MNLHREVFMSEQGEQLRAAAAKLGVGSYRRHVFLCTGPSCCTPEAGLAAWEALKKELKQRDPGQACQRSKVGCVRICCHGPTAVVYPEGTWYHGLTADRVARLVQEHLVEGRPVAEWVFARNPLPNEQAGAG
jgi:(2Fe-2S) ferredoxin